ncbi:penicillin-binding protein 1C [Marinifilum caeruleilacunae]|uniref:peptidoglycan glycosyltransferase n=1 Tax=Marinifilum caeruleilacunae TaxID=2499076 RepID=A0ABX1WX41_9BACT|nr:penicillin-binding protein 1C [Marinifilum caeruleilacunae]NOU60687.1 penicillin-binding protein 1C [Marinifilum caeruleilacunae]
MNIKNFTYCNSKKCRILLLAFFLLCVGFWFSLPKQLFNDPSSTILYSSEQKLLGARIADDGQWRFPESKSVPLKFEKSLLAFEDQYFYSHPGVNPVSIGRAFMQNMKAGKVVSGGSTISMQLIRISQKGKSRTVLRKIQEMILATRLEIRYAKKEILALYASHAPFGGNVVGLEAAAWRFFGRTPDELSWAEAATLAVLPNAPSLIYPGKNSERLLKKRNNLLDKLYRIGEIDSTTCELAKLEDVPREIHRLPRIAPHLLDQVHKRKKGERVTSSLQFDLQNRVNEIVKRHQKNIEANQIYNMAVLVVDTKTREALAYVGNTEKNGDVNHGNQVDIIRSLRSTGSVLKPFLYASMLNEGELLPNTLVPDIPTQIAGYSPKNFDLRYNGAVPAQKALARSLNVPAVRMLRDYGVERFHFFLQKMGMKSLNRPASHYGLSLILGGAEGSLWDICGMYASMAGILNHYNWNDASYYSNEFQTIRYTNDSIEWKNPDSQAFLKASSVYQTFEALLEVNRPDGESGWKSFSSSQKIAWKTGTSFGFRDAWSIGVNTNYVVGVWVGNADGEGRPGLTGVGAAAPVMFDVFDVLPASEWFEQPIDEMEMVPICRNSGHRASRWCDQVDTLWIGKTGLASNVCPYHKQVHLDATGQYRVNSECEKVGNMIHRSWFVLPPAIEWYYKKRNPLYRPLPPYRDDCTGVDENQAMELIYPKSNDRIFIPIELNGTRGKVVFELAHHNPDANVYWHLNGEFMGTTCGNHQQELDPGEGKHVITFVDDEGNSLVKQFEVVGKQQHQIND